LPADVINFFENCDMKKPLAELLVVGKCYFRLGYYDRNLSIPFVEPFIFIGKDLYPDAIGYWFFQSAQEFLDGVSATSVDECEKSGISGYCLEDLEGLVDWAGLIEELSGNKNIQDQGGFLSQRGS